VEILTGDPQQRRMLLNTRAAEIVHKLLGGVVHHSTLSASAPPRAKLLRRLRSVNLMLRAGHSPCEEFWREPGVLLSRVAVLSAGGVHTGRWVYVAREEGATAVESSELETLVQNVLVPHFYARDERLEASVLVKRKREAPAPADGGVGASAPVGVTEGSAAAGAVATGRSAKADAPPGSFGIILRGQLGDELHFRVRPSSAIAKVTSAYCKKKEVDEDTMRFVFNGERLHDGYTVGDFGMKEGDVVDVLVMQVAC
jgi:hypothetical protein